MRSRLLVVSVLAAVGVLGGAAWNASAATNFNVTSSGMSAYVIGGVNNPSLPLTKGQTYTFTINNGFMVHPFWITTAPGSAEVNQNQFADGVSNNGASQGVVTFTVPQSAPAKLFYQCQFHDPMVGTLNIAPAAATAAPSLGTAALTALAFLLMLVATLTLRKRARG